MPTFLTRIRDALFREPPPRRVVAPAPAPAPRAPSLSAADMRAMGAMLDELRRVLDADESHRQTYRRLTRFERKFAEKGIHATEAVPVADLRRALRDFDALVRNWSLPSLADLRSRMAVPLAERSGAASVWIAANSISIGYVTRHDSLQPGG